MNVKPPMRLFLHGALALSLAGMATVVLGQAPAPPPPASAPVPPPTVPNTPVSPPAAGTSPPPARAAMTMPAQDAADQQAGEFYQGTKSSATYPLPDSHGGTLTVNAGMPAQVRTYGPPPPFESLDADHDGRISEAEAQAYPPLDSDFLYASGGGKNISRNQYKDWAENQH